MRFTVSMQQRRISVGHKSAHADSLPSNERGWRAVVSLHGDPGPAGLILSAGIYLYSDEASMANL
jgi:hypothetical protein